MATIETSLAAVAIGFCLICALLLRQLFAHLSLNFLVIYLVLEAFGFGFEWLLVHPDSPYKALWLGLLMASSFLMAPCLWLFAQETIYNTKPRLSRLANIEWALIVLGLLLTLPLILAAHGGTRMIEPERTPISFLLSPIIHEAMLACIALFLFQVPWYLRKCWYALRIHTRQNMALFSNTSDMPLNSLKVLMWLMAGSWILVLLRTLRALAIKGPTHLDLLFTAAGVGITVWALYLIIKRSLTLNADAQLLADQVYIGGENELDGTGDNSDQQRKYTKSSLNNTIRKRIEKKLAEALEIDKLYTKSNLQLRDLCEHLNENLHYVSQVINQSLGTTFYELINGARIGAAKKRLLDKPQESTILGIALDVGFNSKTTFNSAFKRVTGQTPSEYRKACLKLEGNTD